MRVFRVLSLLIIGTTFGCAVPKSGILVMAHGGDDAWNRDVEAVVAPLRAKLPVEIAFGMAQRSTLQSAVARLEQQGVKRIAVVRMFVSGDSFVPETEYILALRDDPPPTAHGAMLAAMHSDTPATEPSPGDPHAAHAGGGKHCMEKPEPIETHARFVLSRAGVAESKLIDQILVDRVKALSEDPPNETLLFLAHGPGDDAENERWLANMRLRVQRVHELGPFRHVQCETLREDWPERRADAERRIRACVASGNSNGGRVIVIPFRVAGFGPYEEILAGLDYVADQRGFCPHPNVTRWIEETAKDCFATRGESDRVKAGARVAAVDSRP